MTEIDSFREQLADIKKRYADRQLLSIQDVSDFTGRDRRTVVKYLGVTKAGISQIELAHRMVKLSHKPQRRYF
jgi:hypothetical protein